MNKPITLCDRCDICMSCLLDYDGIPCRKNRTVEPTNADLFRAMSDEELAKFIERSDCPPHDGICDKDNITCTRCWLDWLQSPAGEEQNGS